MRTRFSRDKALGTGIGARIDLKPDGYEPKEKDRTIEKSQARDAADIPILHPEV